MYECPEIFKIPIGPSKASPLPRSHTAGTGAQFYNHDQGAVLAVPWSSSRRDYETNTI